MSIRKRPAGLVESPVLGDGHAGFGRRPGETHRRQRRQGAPGRPDYGKSPLERQRAQLELLRGKAPDILCIQEFWNNSAGYPHLVPDFERMSGRSHGGVRNLLLFVGVTLRSPKQAASVRRAAAEQSPTAAAISRETEH
jgi:hypothetical protein